MKFDSKLEEETKYTGGMPGVGIGYGKAGMLHSGKRRYCGVSREKF